MTKFLTYILLYYHCKSILFFKTEDGCIFSSLPLLLYPFTKCIHKMHARFFSREEAKNVWVIVVSVCRQTIKLLFSLFARTSSPDGKQALVLSNSRNKFQAIRIHEIIPNTSTSRINIFLRNTSSTYNSGAELFDAGCLDRKTVKINKKVTGIIYSIVKNYSRKTTDY